MSNNRRVTLKGNQNIIVEFTNERIIPAGGLSVVGALLGKSDFVKKLNRMDVTKNRSQHQIKNGDILLTYLGMLCMGKPYFEAVHEMDDDKEFYKAALGITRNIPSEETLRQRMDDIGDSLRQTILEENIALLLANDIKPTALENGYDDDFQEISARAVQADSNDLKILELRGKFFLCEFFGTFVIFFFEQLIEHILRHIVIIREDPAHACDFSVTAVICYLDFTRCGMDHHVLSHVDPDMTRIEDQIARLCVLIFDFSSAMFLIV